MLLALLFAPAAMAQSEGILSGTVSDPAGNAVAGAQVRLEGLGLSANTERGGRYRLTGVPAGDHELRVSYLGTEPYRATVTVGAGETVHQVNLKSDVVVLDKFVVESYAEGQARSINQQRTSNTISNIVSSDKFGNLPDASIGEAMSRLPGVGLQTDRGEASYITIRGAAAKLNSVALNGDRIPTVFDPTATDTGDVRSINLNRIPTDLISKIEVTKAITADLDADSVGGAVNLITKSPLDFKQRVVNGKVSYGINDMESTNQYGANLTYGDKFGPDDRFGLLLNGAYQFNNRPVQAVNPEYRTGTVDGTTYDTLLDQVDVRHRFTDRKRLGGSAQLDFQLPGGSRHYVRAFINQFDDSEERRRFRIRFGSGGTYLTGSNNTTASVDGGRLEHQDRQGLKQNQLVNLALGGDISFPKFDLNYVFSTSRVTFANDRTETTWENRRPTGGGPVVDYTYNRTEFNFPAITDPLGSFSDKASFTLASNRGVHLIRADRGDEQDYTGSVNLKIPGLLGRENGYWKFGVKYRSKERDQRPNEQRYNPTATTPLLLSNFLGEFRPNVLGRYSYGPTTNVKALREYFAANPANFVFNQNSATDINVPGTYVATEDIAAAYGMASIEFSRGTLVAGVRVENTTTEYDSFSVTTTPAGARVVTPVSSSGDYTNLYPSLVYTHRFTDRLLLRAAWTNAISRPDYGDLTLARIVSDSSNTIREGNPDIKPLESMNFDLSLEWYLKSAGVVSVGVFHKELENFRFLATSSITYDAGTGPEPFTLQRPENGPKGSFTGVEFAWTQRLTFLPKPFDGFGITANLALIEGESELPGRGKVDFIPDQLDRITNLTLDYEKRGFTARAAYNYNGVSVFAFGANAAADQYTDHEESFDVSFGYTVRRGIQLFLDGKNLTDSPKKRYYIGNDTRPIEQEYTGYSVIGGVKFDF